MKKPVRGTVKAVLRPVHFHRIHTHKVKWINIRLRFNLWNTHQSIQKVTHFSAFPLHGTIIPSNKRWASPLSPLLPISGFTLIIQMATNSASGISDSLSLLSWALISRHNTGASLKHKASTCFPSPLNMNFELWFSGIRLYPFYGRDYKRVCVFVCVLVGAFLCLWGPLCVCVFFF